MRFGKLTTRRDFLKTSGLLTGGLLAYPVTRNAFSFAADKPQVNIYGWYTNALKEIIPLYAKETGSEVNLIGSYATNSIWWTKMMAGEEWDFFLPSQEWVQRAARSDKLEPLDLAKIPNWRNVSEEGKKATESTLSYKGNIYALPWTLVINALVWNAEHVKETPDSWAILWDSKYKDKISMKDESRLAIMVAALYTGQNPDGIQDWNKIRDTLLAQKALVKKYWTTHEEMSESLATGQVWLSQFNDGKIRVLQEQKVPLRYTVPKEGAPATIDCLAIPKNAKNKEEAYRFMDFMLRPEIIAIMIKLYGYASFYPAAYRHLPEQTQAGLKLPQDWFSRLAWRNFISPEIQSRMDTLWTEVKMKS